VLVIVKDPNLHTPDRRYRAKKAAPWYPFEDSYGPCQILAIHREMSTTAKDHDYKIDVRWFHRKTEVQGETPVNARDFKEEHVMEWENMPSQEVAEIVETGAGAIGKDLFPSMLVGWCSLVDYASKLDGDVVHQIISKSANIKSIQLGRDGVPLIKYICKSFLSDDKAMSHILRHTGKCHAEDMYTQEFVSVEKLLCEMIEEGYDVLPTRRLVRGLRCLGMDEMHTSNLLKTCLTPSSHAGMDFKDEEFGNVELDEDAEELVDDASIKSSDDDVEVMEHDGQSNDKTTKLVKIAATNEVESEVESNSDLEVEDESMWASEKPFHVDISAKKAFYMSMNVTPPSHLYAIENTVNGEEEWQVSVGDVVAIQVDVGSVRRRQSKRMSSELLNHPYSVCWWCAEVLTIYRDLDSTNEAKLLKKTSKDVAEGTASKEYSQFQLELRWLYRMEDIPGFAHSKSEAEDSLVELFETDDVDVFPANTLLGPVTVHSEAAPSTPLASFHQGMPLVHFLCHRFWTLHRKTLMPIGSAETRFQRGMMYSKFLGRGSAIRASFEQATGNTDTSVGLNITSSDWKARFHDTISKLSLAEASAVESGVEVIGREAQQTQIKSFLHSAVKGVNMKDMTDVRNSNVFALFIGGPPGTGKTASVTSIIYQLRKEQAAGSIPEFTFVSLNGMEMRHPFDTYVRLWEAVSPNKEKLNRPKALAKLQLYFSDSSPLKKVSRQQKGDDTRRAVVLLVDEIDYLVTKKESILYNLFDWPMTGYENKSDAQLIVIGISNTLNLPERLHVRLQSRIGKQRCIFNSYSADDSLKIIEGKLGVSINEGKTIFHRDAIRFASRKIASESGDIRKVFQLCKSAAENVFNLLVSGKKTLPTNSSCQGVIGVGDIQIAAKEMFNSILHLAVSHATSYQALLFVALASLQRNTGRERGGFAIEEVVTKMESMANSLGSRKYIPCPQYHMVIGMLCPLGEAGILKLSTPNGSQGICGTNGAGTLVTLNMDAFEVLSSLKDTLHYPLAQKFLGQKLFSFNS